ncbi:MAG: DoxX family membrane protein [Patescibacteria group bacterium]
MERVLVFLFSDIRMAAVWLVARVYLGWEWFWAGWEKVINPAWVGANAGAGVKGFLMGALQKTGGAHPDVSWWYAWFVEHVALPYATTFSYMVAFGELFIGLGLFFGALTVWAAFFGAFLNMNFLWAGTVSVNPTWLLLAVLLLAAWRIAGRYGVDGAVKYYLNRRRQAV